MCRWSFAANPPNRSRLAPWPALRERLAACYLMRPVMERRKWNPWTTAVRPGKSARQYRAFAALLWVASGGATAPTSIIEWNATRPLQWSDYQGHAPSNTEHSALTYSSVRSNSTFLDRQHIAHVVTCVVVKSKSWVKPDHSHDTTLLGHERLHFDITECNARALRSRLARMTSFDECANHIPMIRDSVNMAWNAVQDRYDLETSHGTLAKEQARWARKIAYELDSLAAYGEPRFVVALKP